MSNFVNYPQILKDFRDAITAANLGFKAVKKNANERDYTVPNMPLLDVHFLRVVPENTAGNQYWNAVTIEAVIGVFNMTSRDEAATIRDDLTNKLQNFVRQNQRFSAFVDTTVVGPCEFETGEDAKQGAYVATAVAQFVVMLYSET